MIGRSSVAILFDTQVLSPSRSACPKDRQLALYDIQRTVDRQYCCVVETLRRAKDFARQKAAAASPASRRSGLVLIGSYLNDIMNFVPLLTTRRKAGQHHSDHAFLDRDGLTDF